MIKKTITYVDYNDVERTDDFFFHLNEAEVLEMEMSTVGGLSGYIQKIVNTKDTPGLVKIFKELVLKAFGEKSDDGRRFIKTKEMAEGFAQTEAYSQLFMTLATSDTEATAFINGIVPNKKEQKETPATIAAMHPHK